MTEVFISYKREDEGRVGMLVQALEKSGLSVWWDRELSGGESWRQQIKNALDQAKCVIVIWTMNSTGAEGDFIHDESGQAKRRGILIPVLLDKVDPPLGFGEIQAIDLTHWKGSRHDPFFKDLIAAVSAKLEGLPTPPSKGPMKRLMRRLVYSSLTSVFGLSGLAFGFNLFSAQDQVCKIPFFQPHFSDMCGEIGLGHRPSKIERLAWNARKTGSCEDLRAHIDRFPQGAFHVIASDMLTARRVKHVETWITAKRKLTLFQSQSDVPSLNETAAKKVALTYAQNQAERLCNGFATTKAFRYISAKAIPQIWSCERISDGVVCGFEGLAECKVDEKHIQQEEICG